jgi:hypothetical protein
MKRDFKICQIIHISNCYSLNIWDIDLANLPKSFRHDVTGWETLRSDESWVSQCISQCYFHPIYELDYLVWQPTITP